MIPMHKIMCAIMAKDLENPCGFKLDTVYTEDEVEALYEFFKNKDVIGYTDEFREGSDKTGLPSEHSRHYESRSVAAKMLDGSWVGWTYWYGGGKHGEPYAIDWMEDAYEVEMTEVMKPVMTFKKVEVKP